MIASFSSNRNAVASQYADGIAVPVHVSRDRDPVQRGVEAGRSHGLLVATTVDACLTRFATLGGPGRRSQRGVPSLRERLQSRQRGIADEIQAMATGAGVHPAVLFAVNARTEILAGRTVASECSTVAAAGCGPWGKQNWDWHPEFMRSWIEWVIELDDSSWFATFTEAGLLAKLSINSHGLAVGLSRLNSPSDGFPDDALPVHVLLRVALGRCATVEDVSDLIDEAASCASSCVTVAAVTGDRMVAAVAFSLNASAVIRAGANGILLHTNHFMSDAGWEAGLVGERSANSAPRLRTLSERSVDGHSEDATWTEEPLATHANGDGRLCHHTEADEPATLASVTLLPAARRMSLTLGTPCSPPRAPVEPELLLSSAQLASAAR